MAVIESELQSALKWCRTATGVGPRPAAIVHLSADSRTIQRGDIFVAYPPKRSAGITPSDGRNFIADAVQRGAGAVLYEAANWQWPDALEVPHHGVLELRKKIGTLANAYYAMPDRGMLSVAITGTNGKTSCSQWLAAALSQLSGKCAVIGTLGVGVFQQGDCAAFENTGYTTPDAVQLQRTLSRLSANDVNALVIEASSIGLAEYRLDGLHIDVAMFTNLSRDHLDYHGVMGHYESAKTRLFDWPGLRHAVINLDDPMGRHLIARLHGKAAAPAITGYSLRVADHIDLPRDLTILRASEIRSTATGTAFKIDSPFGSAQLKTKLVGSFNVSNLLAVIGALLTQGHAWRVALAAVENLPPVPGRMQQLGGQDTPLVVIDYAHTPDALQQVLNTLRPVAQQRGGALWCVFGCGGERDAGKRPMMGAAASCADQIIVTSDNPRGENAVAIINQIIKGIDQTRITPETVADRANAILLAVKRAARNDVILLAGKGHETTQEINGKQLPFSDLQHAALALAARATHPGNH